MLKKGYAILCFAALAQSFVSADYSTFLRPRSTTFNQTFHATLTQYYTYHHDLADDTWCSLAVTPFYQKSHRTEKTAELFLPNDNACISVREDGSGDIGSLWLGLIAAPNTMFRSNICLNPQRTSCGAYLQARFGLDHLFPGWWLSFSGAALKVKHNIGLCEYDLENPGTSVGLATVTQALNNSAWSFGKLSPRTLCKTGFDDLQVRLGHDWFWGDDNHIGLYSVGGVPTGKKSQAHFVFEPLVGSNHGSIGVGSQGDYELLRCAQHSLFFLGDVQYRYEFASNEIRSFDLCQQGKWSRFLQVVKPQELAFSRPGINFFTQPVQVKPRNSLDLWLALHYAVCNVNFEVGYDLWYRQREKLKLCSTDMPQIGIYDMTNVCSGNLTSASQTNISQEIVGNNRVPSDALFTPVTVSDLNLGSAASPQALSSTFFGGFSYNPTICSTSVLLGCFGSYELSQRAGALEQWAVGVTLGLQW